MKMPKLSRILETALYVKNFDAAHQFYADILGFPKVPGTRGAFVVGKDILLVFYAPRTLKQKHLPAHGTKGRGHMAFEVPPKEYNRWKKYLVEKKIKIIREILWKKPNFRSLYFHDPSGNVLEIATPGIWEKINLL